MSQRIFTIAKNKHSQIGYSFILIAKTFAGFSADEIKRWNEFTKVGSVTTSFIEKEKALGGMKLLASYEANASLSNVSCIYHPGSQ